MKKSCCFYCGYYQKLKRSDGSTGDYCNDLDCTVDPYEPSCNDEY